MDTQWRLDNIYPSADSMELKEDIAQLNRLTEELNSWAESELSRQSDAAKNVEEYIKRKNELLHYDKAEIYLNLALSVKTSDENLSSMLDRVGRIKANSAKHEALFARYLKGLDIDELIAEKSALKEFEYFLKQSAIAALHTLSPNEELVAAKLKTNGSSLWEKQWEQLTSGLEITFEYKGKSYNEPLSSVRNMAYSKDRGLRLAAFKAELNSYKTVEVPAAFCMNGIKGEVLTLSELRGYSSPLTMTVEQSALTMPALEAMLGAVKEFIPECSRYFEAKAKMLGYNDGQLPFYELFAPVGEDPSYTLEQARDEVIMSFTSFSEEMGSFASNAFEKGWIDLLPKRGKVGGAFCEAVHAVGESRILTNFSGSFNDVVTIAHELGHAYHDSRLYKAAELNSTYPMPIAETASTLCETVLINEVLKDCDEKTALVILENDLSGTMQTLSDIYSRFLFEDEVFKRRAEGTLSAETLCSIMSEAQKEAYGCKLSELHPYMWLCKPHYYDADFNYYNFPYTFGMLLSKALYGRYREMGRDFMPMYNHLLELSAVADLKETAKAAGFNIEDKDFWRYALALVSEEIDTFIQMTKKR